MKRTDSRFKALKSQHHVGERLQRGLGFGVGWPWPDEASARRVLDDAQEILDAPDADNDERYVARCLRNQARNFIHALRSEGDDVPLPEWLREALVRDLVDRDTVDAVAGWLDPHEAHCGKDCRHDDLVEQVIPWLARNHRSHALVEGPGFLWALARLIAQWPVEDVGRLRPVIEPMEAIRRRIPKASVRNRAAHDAVLYDLSALRTLLGLPISNSRIVIGDAAKRSERRAEVLQSKRVQ